jgi:transcriptional regulator with XRE-family HTH domain
VGVFVNGPRRVSGLRREEVAMRAGISVEYYIRLEQGRERKPSAMVCDALARALVLDRDETRHLRELADPRKASLEDHDANPCVPEGTRVLLGTLHVPAIIENKFTDVLVSNTLAQALSPNLSEGVNRIRAVFTDPSEMELHADWERLTANCVAQLRFAVGGSLGASAARGLISDLMQSSDRFRQLWSRHDVDPAPLSPIRLRHPRVGDLELFREKLLVAGTNELAMVVFHAQPDSRSSRALDQLREMATSAVVCG